MRAALAEARLAAEAGEVPIGAVVVCGNDIVAQAHNQREHTQDPSSHAEFIAITQTAQRLGRSRLQDCTVYVTLEPCAMCAGLMVNARIGRCVYGAADPKAGAMQSLFHIGTDTRLNHQLLITSGVLSKECAELLSSFFAARRVTHLAEDAVHEAARSNAAGSPVEEPAFVTPPFSVLLAIDSFKGSATSAQAGAWVSEGILHQVPDAQIACLSIADGGEGTIDALAHISGAERRHVRVHGPFNQELTAEYLLAGDTAVIEMAQAAGIGFSPCTNEAARAASTFGVGEMVLDALAAKATTICISLGGSATTDGGTGFLRALGARLCNAQGETISPGFFGIDETASIDLAPAMARLAGVQLIALSDVTNPLVGAKGAINIFGPQKGFTITEADDAAMVRYGKLLDAAARTEHSLAFKDLSSVPGAGAAGGLGAAVLALGGAMASGIEKVLDMLNFDEAVATVDVVVTGEGMMDGQTAGGKAPLGVAQRAKRAGKLVIAVVGGRADNLDAVYQAGIDVVIPIVRRPMSLEQALTPEETKNNLRAAGETIARICICR